MRVGNFVHRNNDEPRAPTPPQTTERQDRRAIANDLRMSNGGNSVPAGHSRQQSSSIPQAPVYPSSNIHGGRFSRQPEHYQYRETDGAGMLESDVGSDFDVTKSSDIRMEDSEFGYNQGSVKEDDFRRLDSGLASDDQNDVFGQAQDQQSRSPTKSRQSTRRRSGNLINKDHQRQHSSLPVLYKQDEGRNSKKRSRMNEPVYSTPKKGAQGEVNITEFQTGGADGTLTRQLHEDGFDDSFEDENEDSEDVTAHTRNTDANPKVHPENQDPFRSLKPNVPAESSDHAPDFSVEELMHMEFSKLSNESWESNKERPEFVLPEELDAASLEERIDHFAKSSSETQWDDQVAFYQSLSPEEWDEAGDHILSEIGKIFQGLKEAKKNKRKALEEIEAEIEARDKLIRGKSAKIDAKFVAMQAGGEGLLKGKH